MALYCLFTKNKDMTLPTKKQISPYSLRFTPEERARLDKDAAGMSLADYIRSRLFDESMPKRRTRNKFPVKDHQALARVLAEIGQSRMPSNLNQLAKAVNCGSLEVSPEFEKAILNACGDIRWMRHALMAALGIIPESHHDP